MAYRVRWYGVPPYGGDAPLRSGASSPLSRTTGDATRVRPHAHTRTSQKSQIDDDWRETSLLFALSAFVNGGMRAMPSPALAFGHGEGTRKVHRVYIGMILYIDKLQITRGYE